MSHQRSRNFIAGRKSNIAGGWSFWGCKEKLDAYGLVDVIHQIVEKKIPFLGICLGLQLLFESSDETPGVEGLGILKGKIVAIPHDKGLKIPHIGWNSLSFPNEGRLFRGLSENAYVYFVHSYYLQAEERRHCKSNDGIWCDDPCIGREG